MPLATTMDNTFGLLFDVAILSAILYGAACLQAWFYLRRYWKKDAWYITTIVSAVMILDTVQLGIFYASVYTYLVTNHGNSAFLAVLVPDLIIELFFSAFIALFVQLFYAYRIWKLSQSILAAVPVVLLSISAFVVLTLYSVGGMRTSQIAHLIELANLSTACMSLAAATDVAISIIMMLILQRSKTGFRRSTDIMNRLIIFTFTTGIPTSVTALLVVVMVNAEPNTFLYIFFYLLVSRFYTNSLLVMLNSREYIRGETSELSSTGNGNAYAMTSSSRGNHTTNHAASVAIRIDTSVQNEGDNDYISSKHDAYELDTQRKGAQAV
ncbi:hypothetical protein BDZ89DRAFT_486677 [Hymenopellis radicata]|nr:hypothetical protein BDZ89DRAFT_486677 [Hymenopellis radicata]